MDMMQIFGDYLHLLAMIILLMTLLLTKKCAGISGKTQLLNALVITTRYLNVTITYVSLYDTILKIVFIGIIYCTVLSIFLLFRNTYDWKSDAFRIELLILPSAVLALFVNYRFETLEVLRAFSAYLEAVAIVPQVYLVSKSKQIEAIVVSYVACLGLYQGCYIMHWLCVHYANKAQGSVGGRLVNIDVACGIVQLIFYVDFFARNLPILKAKEASAQRQAAYDGNARSRSRKLDENVQSVLVTKPQTLEPPKEKVTLLEAKEQGASN